MSIAAPRQLAAALLCAVVLTFAASAAAPADAKPRAHKCGSLSLGTAYFTKIRATRVSCKKAKHMLDKATLQSNRQGASFWYWGGWAWSVQGLDEMTSKIRGKRGKRRVTATWSAT